ncbi:MAG: hypothetical protein JWO44_2586 [Bacteroidetes bacterium]|nr:hypothetical protein [Bacteroidota bacterium]
MKRILSFVLLSFFLFKISLSQSSLSGQLSDAGDQSPLIGASVILLKPDSSLYKGTTADLDGKFLVENINRGTYILKISFIGYADDFRRLDMADVPVALGSISLKPSSKMLKDVVITEKALTAVQKGDTTQYNAASYKTNPDANAEDLITKMSGVTTQDGKVQAHGEEVKRVLVDGKPFFGDDPNAVLKNLPADVIDKIQVFDQQSDQSKFTGVSDGNTTKTINIITKPGMKNGTFGKVYAGYGYDDVYKAGFNINFFKGDRRISIVSQSNNINEQNFSSDDLAGVLSSSSGGGGGMRGGRGGMGGGNPGGGNSGSNFLVNAKNGISTTHAFGLNYSDKWNKKTEVSASYFLNYADNIAEQFTNRQYLPVSDSGIVYRENSINNSVNINHRFNLKLEWKMDTSNSITYTPKFSLQQNTGKSNLYGQNTSGNDTLNRTTNFYNSEVMAYNFSNELLLQHKFKKQGRTISLNLNGTLSSNTAQSDLHSINTYYNDTSFFSNVLDQQATLTKPGSSYGSNLTYTEPLGVKSILQFSYSNSFNFTENTKKTFNYSQSDDSYNNLDTLLSNVFNSEYITHKGGLGYRYNNAKLQFMAGANYQYATLTADQSFPYTYSLVRNYQNILPNAMLRYNFSTKKSLRIMYRTQTTQPAIDQLQNVLNNTNPTQLSIGNPGLQQNYENTMFLRYSSSNTEKATSFFAMLAGTYTDNYIANSTFTASKDTVRNGIAMQRGTQITQPVNVNGYVNLRSFITYGIPLSILKCNLNINANAAYTKTPGIVNDVMNYSNAQTYGGGLTLSSNISKQVDFTLSTNLTYNTVENTINKQLNTQYYNQNSRLKMNVIFLKNVVFSTDLTHQYYQGLSQGYNQNYLLWNAALGYKFLKDQKAEIRLSVNDILEQNTSITRNTTETYIEDVRTNLLQRYFMLTFTYNIKVFKKAAEDKSKATHE